VKDPRPSTFIIRLFGVFSTNWHLRITYCYKEVWRFKKAPFIQGQPQPERSDGSVASRADYAPNCYPAVAISPSHSIESLRRGTKGSNLQSKGYAALAATTKWRAAQGQATLKC
jgi:hypothetical protein